MSPVAAAVCLFAIAIAGKISYIIVSNEKVPPIERVAAVLVVIAAYIMLGSYFYEPARDAVPAPAAVEILSRAPAYPWSTQDPAPICPASRRENP